MKIILEKEKSNNFKNVSANLTLFQFIKFLQKCQDALLYVNLNETKKTYLLCVKIDLTPCVYFSVIFHGFRGFFVKNS